VVRLVPRDAGETAIEDPAMLDRVVRDAFAQRRKTLRNALSKVADADAIAAGGVDPAARAEDVEVAAFVALANALARSA
jgi:16S rRNA (adenine1518-N6/adenine1519-N6)-dimethyltransferase